MIMNFNVYFFYNFYAHISSNLELNKQMSVEYRNKVMIWKYLCNNYGCYIKIPNTGSTLGKLIC